MPLRLLFLYDCLYPDSVGGVEHRNACLGRALAKRGHAVTLAGWSRGPVPLIEGVQTIALPGAAPLYDPHGKRQISAALRFAWACRTLDLSAYDIIETANIPYLHLPLLARRAQKLSKPLCVTWYEVFDRHWGVYKAPWAAGFFRLFERWAATKGDQVCAISPLTIDRFHNIAPARSRPFLAACGVDLADMAARRRPPDPQAPPLLYAGRLIPEKRVDLLIKALSFLPALPDRPLLTLIGDGPDRARLEALAAANGVSEKCFFRGKLPEPADVWHELARARIAVQPSAREGFGLMPLEAMALGKPVVYCEGPLNAISGLVRDGLDGLCAQATPQALAQALSRLLTDDILWAAQSAVAQAHAAAYDWNALAKEMEAFFYTARPDLAASTPV